MPHKRAWSSVLDTTATIAIIVAAVAVTWSVVTRGRTQFTPPNAAPLQFVEDISQKNLTMARLHDRVGGGGSGKVALVEFSDFECPFCGQYARETLPRLRADFLNSQKLVYVFRHFPIEALHPHARYAAGAAACAQSKGRFWDMHEWLARLKTLRT